MIKTEEVMIKTTPFIHTWSDKRMKIQDESGAMYDEALDLKTYPKTYTETNEPIDTDEEPLTAEEIVEILTGEEEEA